MSTTIGGRIEELAQALALANMVAKEFPDAQEDTMRGKVRIWVSKAAVKSATQLYATSDSDGLAVLYAAASVECDGNEKLVFAQRYAPIGVNAALDRLRVKFPEAYADLVWLAANV